MQEYRLAGGSRKPPPPDGGCDPLSKRSDHAEDGTDRKSVPRSADTRQYVSASSGTGKTHIALGLSLAACQRGLAVSFTTAAAVVHELIEARDEKRLLRLQRQLAAYKLLVIDELGYVPLSQTGAELLFEVFSQRYERGSTMVTSNLPFDEWTSVFASERLTGALLDRLTHHVHILEMNGDSYRLKQSKRRQRGARSADTPDNSADG
jgi:chromosomal replication initiation ATPase DnaA